MTAVTYTRVVRDGTSAVRLDQHVTVLPGCVSVHKSRDGVSLPADREDYRTRFPALKARGIGRRLQREGYERRAFPAGSPESMALGVILAAAGRVAEVTA